MRKASETMRELRYLNKYLKKYRIKILIGLFITIISRIFSLFAPRLIGNSLTAVEKYIIENKETFESLKELLLNNILIIIAATLLSGFFTFLMRQTIINVSRYIEFDLKNEIFNTSTKPCLVTTHLNRLEETIPMNGHKIRFH